MFTLCWTNSNADGWDRFSTREELESKVKDLIAEGYSNEDMLVFSPSVDYIVPEEDGTIILQEGDENVERRFS